MCSVKNAELVEVGVRVITGDDKYEVIFEGVLFPEKRRRRFVGEYTIYGVRDERSKFIISHT